MALTYTTLKQALQDYVQSDETTFVDNIPIIVKQAEDRILKSAQLPVFRKNVSGAMTTDDPYLMIPTDFLAPYSMGIIGGEYLMFKEVNFVRAAYPAAATTGTPKYYSIFEDLYFLLGPTPDANYSTELHYLYRPESIVTAETSWLGTNAESTLLYGCLVESEIFHKGDTDMQERYQAKYDDALARLKLLGEGYNKTDSYRVG